jgi:NTE family protein
MDRPDVLVLAGGGLVGEAWMTGVLAGVEAETEIDFRACDAFVGTSAGSIVSAHLAAGRRPRRPEFPPQDLPAESPDLDGSEARALAALLRTALSPFAAAALAVAAPGGALARAALLARLPDGGQRLEQLHGNIEGLGARFDGRLLITAVDRRRGTRTVFGAPGAPPASVADAVIASCTVPTLFAPVRIGGRDYVDGGVWSPTNLDVAPAGQGTEVLCLQPTARLRVGVRALARPHVGVEAAVLRRRGARVRVVGPDDGVRRAMGTNFMDGSRRAPALAAGYDQGRALARSG